MLLCYITSNFVALMLSCAAPQIDAKDTKGPEIVDVILTYETFPRSLRRATAKVQNLPEGTHGVRVTVKFESKTAQGKWKEIQDSSVILTTTANSGEAKFDSGYLQFVAEQGVEYRVTASGVYENEKAKPLGKIKPNSSIVMKPIP
jgi:hypothetical protein